ncbi:hypothetical protein L1987_56810 [Smallanthus sonchifolius]|uniref:Uncharacterized protein n=1 Tax=Smallanthus sonchifolius TaxID=185202 RepID=A0ACB9DB23_9ASTR|nr:hypothetical protein L1987_56810 [Smallanthus sonchifolius]
MGEVKHIVLAKFKDAISQQQIDDLIKGYANLVNRIEPMKSFQWGKDVSIENMHQGFTHVFESTFETTEDIATYVSHPAHVEFATAFLMGEVKHILLAKFKDGISQQQIDDLIKGYADLVNHIEPMKSCRWGKDVSIENLHQGFTHVFESTFETTEGIATYISHPVHVEFATVFLGHLDKVLVVDYKPTTVDP